MLSLISVNDTHSNKWTIQEINVPKILNKLFIEVLDLTNWSTWGCFYAILLEKNYNILSGFVEKVNILIFIILFAISFIFHVF